MARKQVIQKSTLNSWEEVNESLRQIAEKKSYVDGVIARYNEAEAKRRKEIDEKVNPVQSEIGDLENNMRLFCEEHRDEFGKRKSRELINGLVSFRTGTPKARTLKGYTWQVVIDLLKKSPFKNLYLRIKEDADKEAIIRDFSNGSIDNLRLNEFGIEITQEETFGYEAFVAAENKGAA
jgi:phage host-nuclease inhibitor protein Gam